MIDINAQIAQFLSQYGIQISVGVLASLLGLAIWIHRLSRAGSVAASAGSRAVRDLQIVLVAVLLFTLVGWVSIQPEQIQASFAVASREAPRLFRQVVRWVP